MEIEELESRLSMAGKEYRNIPVPDDMQKRLGKAVKRAERSGRFYIPAVAAAAMLTLAVLPNTDADIAYAMGNIPVVGGLFKVVTFRDYQYEDGRFSADVQIPQIKLEDIREKTEMSDANSDLEETIKQVNFDIEKVTKELVAEFEASAALGESYNDLEIQHESVTDNDRYFALRLFIYQGAGSGTQSYKIYTIDKLSGSQIKLKDLFLEGSDYNTRISENIREQMRGAMAADTKKAYWVDRDENPEMNWKGLTEEQNFYFDKDNNLVIAFDEYEVAPGYMGAQEFTVEQTVYKDLLK
ncbi:MAG: RsiV family protein [Lachnospiraceae bacterium]|jgi:hypothetical protein|nr:RsiV family protein [Lachnospiraceae bacterium]